MILGILIVILSYLFFSFSFFSDKLVLSGPPHPRLYTFYVNMLSGMVVFLLPFIGFHLPPLSSVLWIVLDGVVYVVGMYILFLILAK